MSLVRFRLWAPFIFIKNFIYSNLNAFSEATRSVVVWSKRSAARPRAPSKAREEREGCLERRSPERIGSGHHLFLSKNFIYSNLSAFSEATRSVVVWSKRSAARPRAPSKARKKRKACQFVVKIATFCSVRHFAHSGVHASTPHSSKCLSLQKFINFSSQIM